MLEASSAGATRQGGVVCGGFGLVLRAAAHRNPDQRGPIIVSRIIPLSPADRLAANILHIY